MVKLSLEMMTKKASSKSRLKSGDDLGQFVSKLTHLNLQDRNIESTGSVLKACSNLMVLYLYDNLLTEIPDVTHNKRLTSLNLQNNRISYIERLGNFKSLKKLYLGYNSIAVVEGLEGLSALEELYMEHQRLPPGESLIFDPLSINAISNTLCIVDVSHNHLSDISAFTECHKLQEFIATHNQLSSAEEVAEVIKDNWTSVTRINLFKNPLTKQHRYRDIVINSSPDTLEFLDEKEVTERSKEFIKGFQSKLQQDNLLKKTTLRKRAPPNKKHQILHESRTLDANEGSGDKAMIDAGMQSMLQHSESFKPFFDQPPFSVLRTEEPRTPVLAHRTFHPLKTDPTSSLCKESQDFNLLAVKTVMHDKETIRSKTENPPSGKSHRNKKNNNPEAPPSSCLGFYED